MEVSGGSVKSFRSNKHSHVEFYSTSCKLVVFAYYVEYVNLHVARFVITLLLVSTVWQWRGVGT